MDQGDLHTAVAIEIHRSLPRSITDTLREDPAVRQGFARIFRSTITFGETNLRFSRGSLFNAIRMLFGSGGEKIVVAEDGTEWRAHVEDIEGRRHPVLTTERKRVVLPDFWYLSPVEADRNAGMERDMPGVDSDDPELWSWRESLVAGPLGDEEASLLDAELKLLPRQVAALISAGIESGTSQIATLVPSKLRYYERLIGQHSDEDSISAYLQKGAVSHVKNTFSGDPLEGAKAALLLASHPHFSRILQTFQRTRDEIGNLFDWLVAAADRMSQVGGFEWGMTLLDKHPEIEGHLLSIARQIYSDDPESDDSRLQQLSTLIIFVEGGVARSGFMRSKPPFWRRMATIAQASLIERELVASGFDTNATKEWPSGGRGQYFYIQTLVDMQREPRWLPDFVEPKQLKAEFVGRVFTAARDHASTIKSQEMRDFLLAESGDNLRSQLSFPFSFLPGPLEGSVEAQTEPPVEISETVRNQLSRASTDPNGFTALVNSCLVFKIGPEMAQMAADAIRGAKYLIRAGEEKDQTFPLLGGLATVAAVTRSKELAQEVRILARVVRRRSKGLISTDAYFRIAMFAAAAHSNAEWRRYVGEWITELAFEALEQEDARVIKSHLQVLLKIDPALWPTCARARTALDSFLAVAAYQAPGPERRPLSGSASN